MNNIIYYLISEYPQVIQEMNVKSTRQKDDYLLLVIK
jgi:hypothetical protein